MAATTMQFGPEWMRSKQTSAASNTRTGAAGPSPPPNQNTINTNASPPTLAPAGSTYSSLLNSTTQTSVQPKADSNPFKYSREDFLRVWKEGGGHGPLGLEVERWDGIIREDPAEPVGLKDWSDAERKYFATSLNSVNSRRQQSHDAHTGGFERPKLPHSTSNNVNSRYPGLGTRPEGRPQPLTLPRKLSISGQPPLSPRDSTLQSPRTRGTTGFDGVLGSSGWTSRRAASESNWRSAPKKDDSVPEQIANETLQEESPPQSENDAVRRHDDDPSSSLLTNSQSDPTNGIANQSTKPSQANGQTLVPPPDDDLTSRPPPGLGENYGKVQWTYLDPSGHAQGPFSGDTMQKWHDQGYFTPDLRLKRVGLDKDYFTVSELIIRAGAEKTFLSRVGTPPPPGLPPPRQRIDTSTAYSQPMSDPLDQLRGAPFQPIPRHGQRTNTFDPFLNPRSAIVDSPSSSYGSGFGQQQRSTDSPDLAFGGRTNSAAYESPFSARPGVFASSHDPLYTTRLDSPGAAFGASTANMPFSESRSFQAFGPSSSNNDLSGNRLVGRGEMHDSPFSNASSSLPNATAPISSAPFGAIGSKHSPLLASQAAYTQTSPETGLHVLQNASNLTHSAGLLHSPSLTSLGVGSIPRVPVPQTPVTLESPWGRSETPPRARAFDAPHPTTANVGNALPAESQGRLPVPAVSSPWDQIISSQPQSSIARESSPWYTASAGVIDSGWGAYQPDDAEAAHPVYEKTSLDEPALLAPRPDESQDHIPDAILEPPKVENQVVRPLSVDTVPEAPFIKPVLEPILEPTPALAPEPDFVPTPEPTHEPSPEPVKAPSGRRAKTSAKVTSTPVSAPAKKPSLSTKASKTVIAAEMDSAIQAKRTASPPPVSTPISQPKPVWGISEDEQGKLPVAISLRDIQQAEVKKSKQAEPRKVSDRERPVRKASGPPEEIQTMSWGLPTSQKGAARNTTPAQSVSPPTATASQAASAAAWTKATSTKKSMKEIQEEEEKQKLAAAQAKAGPPVAKKAYAESANKPTAAQSLLSGGAWTTVGSGGKTNVSVPTPPPPSAVRPPPTAVPASQIASTPGRNINGASNTSIVSKLSASSVSRPSRGEEIVPPSAEFVKWLREVLRGLNPSVNVEETMQMLLSFSLDFPPSTVEVISDLIYASSTTMDGRRFAAEFVGKRKTDAASSPKSGGGGAAGKRTSLADVVKTQPKSAQSEWSTPYKVVQKKKGKGKGA